jgi:hypothetical protein
MKSSTFQPRFSSKRQNSQVILPNEVDVETVGASTLSSLSKAPQISTETSSVRRRTMALPKILRLRSKRRSTISPSEVEHKVNIIVSDNNRKNNSSQKKKSEKSHSKRQLVSKSQKLHDDQLTVGATNRKEICNLSDLLEVLTIDWKDDYEKDHLRLEPSVTVAVEVRIP